MATGRIGTGSWVPRPRPALWVGSPETAPPRTRPKEPRPALKHTSPSPNRRKKNIQTSWGGCRHEGERERDGGVVRCWLQREAVRWLAAWDRQIGMVAGMVAGGNLREWVVWGKLKWKWGEREREVAGLLEKCKEKKYIYIYIYVGNKNPNGIFVIIDGAGRVS